MQNKARESHGMIWDSPSVDFWQKPPLVYLFTLAEGAMEIVIGLSFEAGGIASKRKKDGERAYVPRVRRVRPK